MATALYYSGPIQALRHLVASSSTFRVLTGSSSESEALNRVHFPLADDREGSVDPKPRAIISHFSWDLRNIGSATWKNSGQLYLSFESEAPPTIRNLTDGTLWFCQYVLDPVITEMRDKSGQNLTDNSGTYLNMRELSQYVEPQPIMPDEENGELFYVAAFLIPWM